MVKNVKFHILSKFKSILGNKSRKMLNVLHDKFVHEQHVHQQWVVCVKICNHESTPAGHRRWYFWNILHQPVASELSKLEWEKKKINVVNFRK